MAGSNVKDTCLVANGVDAHSGLLSNSTLKLTKNLAGARLWQLNVQPLGFGDRVPQDKKGQDDEATAPSAFSGAA